MSIPRHCEERSEAAIQNAGRSAGLPRFIRIDGNLRAFAASREPNLLFDSREAAKTRRRLVCRLAKQLMVGFFVLSASFAEACPKPAYLISAADVAFEGTGVFTRAKGGGQVRVQKRIKGHSAKSEFVHIDVDIIAFDCSDFFGLRLDERVTGKFLLKRSASGQLKLFQFYESPPKAR